MRSQKSKSQTPSPPPLGGGRGGEKPGRHVSIRVTVAREQVGGRAEACPRTVIVSFLHRRVPGDKMVAMFLV